MWRFEPLDLARFPPGEGPFRARGLAYAALLRYVDKKLPGGRTALKAALGERDPFATFYDQLFLAISDYDVSPLVRLYTVLADLAQVPVARFVADRAAWSGNVDPKSVWKQPLKGDSVGEIAGRLHFAFDRYFPPCRAEPRRADADMFAGELLQIPACMNGLYAHSTVGFYVGALEGAGARKVRVDFERPSPSGLHRGIAVERLRFTVRWSADMVA